MNIINPKYRAAIVFLLFVFLVALIPGLRGHGYDSNCWRNWTNYIHIEGLRNAYGSHTNYTPLYQYIMWAFGKVAGSMENIYNYIGYLRVPTLALEFYGIWMAWKWTDGRVDYLTMLLLSIFNVGFIYDTLIWGQVDCIMATLVFASLMALYYDRPILSGVLMVLALNMKLQALPFVPFWGLLLIEHFIRKGRWLRMAGVIGGILLTQGVLLAPFAFGRGGLRLLWDTIFNIPNTDPYVTMNACNVWFWLVPNADMDIEDIKGNILGLNYLNFGLLLFCIASFFAFLPLFTAMVKQLGLKRRGIVSRLNRELIWLTAALLPILFFFFNTRMHERYPHPAFIFLTAYAFYNGRFGLLALFSLAFFLNVERILKWFKLPNYGTFVFEPKFISILFALVIAGIYYRLYRLMRQRMLVEAPAA